MMTQLPQMTIVQSVWNNDLWYMVYQVNPFHQAEGKWWWSLFSQNVSPAKAEWTLPGHVEFLFDFTDIVEPLMMWVTFIHHNMFLWGEAEFRIKHWRHRRWKVSKFPNKRISNLTSCFPQNHACGQHHNFGWLPNPPKFWKAVCNNWSFEKGFKDKFLYLYKHFMDALTKHF